MDLPGTPRSISEIQFYVEHSPCEHCGQTGLTDESPGYRSGSYRGTCAQCRVSREFLFRAVQEYAPAWHLGFGDTPSSVMRPEDFRAIADKEMAHVPTDPLVFSTVASYDIARRHLVQARIAITEWVKFDPQNPKMALELENVAVLWDRYVAAKVEIECKPGALPPPVGLDGRYAQHLAWLARGRRGDGQLVMRHEHWRSLSFGSPKLQGAMLEDTTFEKINLSYGDFKNTAFTRVRFLACGISMSELNGAHFEQCDLRGSSVTLSDLICTSASGGDWQQLGGGRSTWRARITGVDLRGASMRDSVLDGTTFYRCDLRGADFSRKDTILTELGTARGTLFRECDLRGIRVEGWRLAGTVFERCRMHGIEGIPVLEEEIQFGGVDLSADGKGRWAAGKRLLDTWKRKGGVAPHARSWCTLSIGAALRHEGPLLAVFEDLPPSGTLLRMFATGGEQPVLLAQAPLPDMPRIFVDSRLRRIGIEVRNDEKA